MRNFNSFDLTNIIWINTIIYKQIIRRDMQNIHRFRSRCTVITIIRIGSLKVKDGGFTVNDSNSNACNDTVSISTSVNNVHNSSSDDVNVNDCFDLDNVCEIKTVDISHESPFTIIKNENIPSNNHIRTCVSRDLNEKASKSQKGKMVNF